MKLIKRVFLAMLVVAAVGFLFRGWIYRYLVTYKSVGVRSNYPAKDKALIAYIDEKSDKQSEPNVEGVIKSGLAITSSRLRFTVSKNDVDPNKLISSRTAHCVGYASFFATTCNFLLKKYGLASKWMAKPQVGQLYFLGINAHQYFHSPFFKDHDFVLVENKTTGQIFAVDPTVNDYMAIDLVSYAK